MEIRDFLVTFPYRNDLSTEFSQYVIQDDNTKSWKEIRAAFCLPYTDIDSFTFKFGVRKFDLAK
jgi:hypothetical protein